MENETQTALDAEIDALLAGDNGGITEPPSAEDAAAAEAATAAAVAAAEAAQKAAASAPLKIDIPPELLTQGTQLAELAQKYLSGNADALKAITDRLSAPPSTTETVEEKQTRVNAAIAEFFTDPEKAIAKLQKPAAAPKEVDLQQALLPAYEAKGDRVIERFLTEMKESEELAFDPKLTKEIEKEFWSAARRLTWNGGSVEAAIGSAKGEEARQVLSDMYARAVGAQAITTRKEGTKTGKISNVSGGALSGRGITGVSDAKLELAKATARGLATGDDGKVDEKDYREYLRLAIGQ